MYKINSNIKTLRELPVSGIYQIRNLANNKIYIGSAEKFDKRKREHFYRLRKGTHANSHLQNAYNKYGKDSFVFEVLEYIENKSLLLKYEQYFLDYFNMIAPDEIYNICLIAGNTAGRKFSEETKEKISKSHKGMAGKKHSPETRRKMSEWQIGRTLSPETRANISKGRIGLKLKNKRICSPEAKARLKIASIGKSKGIKNGNAKLTEYDVIEIKKMIGENIPGKTIAEKFNVTPGNISAIKTGRNWKHVK